MEVYSERKAGHIELGLSSRARQSGPAELDLSSRARQSGHTELGPPSEKYTTKAGRD